jgi:hypothetical protein
MTDIGEQARRLVLLAPSAHCNRYNPISAAPSSCLSMLSLHRGAVLIQNPMRKALIRSFGWRMF